tara:strand:+ start:47 stop:967 length:921 start_codon:yes stop_codon:yes gene_type:complete
MNFAGDKLVNFVLHNPLGEEIAEGTLGGLLAGGAMLGSDQSLGETALQTAAAIAGGIGLGMGGRRIGAALGKRLHPAALKNQDSLIANLSRMAGSETTAQGLRNQGAIAKKGIQEALVKQTSDALLQEALSDPRAFASKYKIDPAVFVEVAPQVAKGRIGAAVVQNIQNVDPNVIADAVKNNPQVSKAMKAYSDVENLITGKAASDIDANLEAAARFVDNPNDQEISEALSALGVSGNSLRKMVGDAPQITGEEVGRALGRALGDEVGVLGGLALGGLAADAMGLEGEKDRQIKRLQQQIQEQANG